MDLCRNREKFRFNVSTMHDFAITKFRSKRVTERREVFETRQFTRGCRRVVVTRRHTRNVQNVHVSILAHRKRRRKRDQVFCQKARFLLELTRSRFPRRLVALAIASETLPDVLMTGAGRG